MTNSHFIRDLVNVLQSSTFVTYKLTKNNNAIYLLTAGLRCEINLRLILIDIVDTDVADCFKLCFRYCSKYTECNSLVYGYV